MIREFLNGATRLVDDQSSRFGGRQTQGTETSKYLEEKKIIMIPPVAASERGIAQTKAV